MNLGNQFNANTYRYADKPIYQIPLPTYTTYPWSKTKNFEACKKEFLWFGSRGLVHKGLDLVLEAFVDMPEYHLTVCGPIQVENPQPTSFKITPELDFENAYKKELYKTANINTIGWVDVESPLFKKITNQCVAVIYPSCSESSAGSVVTCMQTGMIPCVSYESCIDVDDFGITLEECSIAQIQKVVKQIASASAQSLEDRSKKAWKFARTYHTIEYFSAQYSKLVKRLISKDREFHPQS